MHSPAAGPPRLKNAAASPQVLYWLGRHSNGKFLIDQADGPFRCAKRRFKSKRLRIPAGPCRRSCLKLSRPGLAQALLPHAGGIQGRIADCADVPRCDRRLDLGDAPYAPNTLVNDDGRHLMWVWIQVDAGPGKYNALRKALSEADGPSPCISSHVSFIMTRKL